ncbi:hypothetical protein DFH05DRAFT_1539458 [Lentinula detonsa]|uniref:Ribosomal protein/NADH dehydrogenase domain-containing protein n=2 Tax=Lentinula TaxID=5352 RepID=A0A9W8PCC7_9AGAR|nr:hypothetical protein DFH05DRAFT_1539458 [Lentinula detonsa]KAJ3788114.1 hypothetical protein GGU10DRAFT_123847 [Lentinula aff. detonsa]KAJ3988210.1 hypothetical protein F5890DRAFT_1577562 [Lentinula detonsa]
MGKAPIGPSHISKVLDALKTEPKLSLFGVRSLKLSYAYRNDHFGARHFVKEELPRIRYANPNLKIEVDRTLKTKEEHWRPEMELQLDNGTIKAINMHDKWSTTILQELLDLSGGDPWKKWKRTRSERGLPLLKGEDEAAAYVSPDRGAATYMNLKEWRGSAQARALAQEKAEKERMDKAKAKAKEKEKKKAAEVHVAELSPEVLENLRTKTGAAAILP